MNKNNKKILQAGLAVGIALIMMMPMATMVGSLEKRGTVRAATLPSGFTMSVENTTASVGEAGHYFRINGTWSEPINEYTMILYFDPTVIAIANVTVQGCVGIGSVYYELGSNYVMADWYLYYYIIPPGQGSLFNISININANAAPGQTSLSFDTEEETCAYAGNSVWFPDLFNGHLNVQANQPPGIPNQPTGPTSGHLGTVYTYTTNPVTDPDGDNVFYLFNWGDGFNSSWNIVPSASHFWSEEGTFDVKVKSMDVHGYESGWSPSLSVVMVDDPPATPTQPVGPTSGTIDSVYSYSTTATDPEGHHVQYRFNWGNGQYSSWTSLVNSGQPASKSFTWLYPGIYEVNAQAKDEYGKISPWSSPLLVTISGSDRWNMFHHDAGHTGFTASSAPYHIIQWNASIPSQIYSSPAIVDGKIYVAAYNNKVYCFNASDGHQLWNHSTGGSLATSPAVVDGRVFVGSNAGIYCLDASTGAPLWNSITDGIYASSPVVMNNRVYFGTSHNGNVDCFNASNGNLIWASNPGGGITSSSPAVVDNRVYIGSDSGLVYCLNASNNGQLLWSYLTGGQISSSPTVFSERVYVGSNDNKLYCLDALNGQPIWNYTTNGHISSSPAVAYGKIYVGSSDNKTYCLDATTGALLWNYATSSEIFSSPAIADGRVYITSSNHTICLNATDGTLLWELHNFGSGTFNSPVIANEQLYITTTASTNNVFCVGGHNSAPAAPERPLGPSSGYINVPYSYTTSTTDPDGDQIYYKWNWGTEESDWIGPYVSGATIHASHTWSTAGTYNVTVKAKDTNDQESDWSEPLQVTINNAPAEPNLIIDTITGGFGVATTVKNNGTVDATNVTWNISLSGGIILIGKQKTGTISTLAAGETATIKSFIFGFGKSTITVHAVCDEGSSAEKSANGFVFLFLVLGIKS